MSVMGARDWKIFAERFCGAICADCWDLQAQQATWVIGREIFAEY